MGKASSNDFVQYGSATPSFTTFVFKRRLKQHFLIFRFHELNSPLHLLNLHRAFVAAGAAYHSLNLSSYITLHYYQAPSHESVLVPTLHASETCRS